MDKAALSLSPTSIANAFAAASSSSQHYSSSSLNYSCFRLLPRPFSCRSTKLHAKLGGDEGGGLKQPAEKKKFITREQEPEQYWQTAGEREGENPMKTPLPYIIIFGMSTPFIILAIAFANGWIKAPILR